MAQINFNSGITPIEQDGDLDITDKTNFIVVELYMSADDAIIFVDETSQIVFI